jgi:diaminohydroxyphosphoribosylaminopyrimidine deaminase/5-amino-6-(5-phosphoribosylamino)uracil reductase
MLRCIELARNGLGNTSPNPMVGSVIVYDGIIIGEGYHRKFGEPHAEVNAINSVQNKELLKKSTLYVNLEPCSHYGKTPPCANLIASMEIPRVVIGSLDTAAHVSGKGLEILKNAGCNVLVGVLEDECRELNKRFFTFHEKQRPYIILKWAQTKDGFIDIERTENASVQPTWITNEYAKALVHKWRAEEQAILVGTNTAIQDNPSLTTRHWYGKNPLRIVLDENLILPDGLKLFDQNASTVIIADTKVKSLRKRKLHENVGIEFVDYSSGFYTQLFKVLISKDIQSLIIEGGEKVLTSFIQNNLWDEARVFTGNKVFNKGVRAPDFSEKGIKLESLGDSILTFIKK